MMKIKLDHFIRLIVPDELHKDDRRKYATVAKLCAPDGVIGSVRVNDKKGSREVSMVRRRGDGLVMYEIPLTRDLTEEELYHVFEAWEEHFEDGDFDIECSGTEIAQIRSADHDDALTLDPEITDALAERLSKDQHQKWVDERTKNGWRFGETVSRKNKTHPMMRDWNSLPEKYRQIDYDLPSTFLKLMDELGYTLTEK